MYPLKVYFKPQLASESPMTTDARALEAKRLAPGGSAADLDERCLLPPCWDSRCSAQVSCQAPSNWGLVNCFTNGALRPLGSRW